MLVRGFATRAEAQAFERHWQHPESAWMLRRTVRARSASGGALALLALLALMSKRPGETRAGGIPDPSTVQRTKRRRPATDETEDEVVQQNVSTPGGIARLQEEVDGARDGLSATADDKGVNSTDDSRDSLASPGAPTDHNPLAHEQHQQVQEPASIPTFDAPPAAAAGKGTPSSAKKATPARMLDKAGKAEEAGVVRKVRTARPTPPAASRAAAHLVLRAQAVHVDCQRIRTTQHNFPPLPWVGEARARRKEQSLCSLL